MTSASAAKSWATGVACAALAVPALLASVLLADPRAYDQMPAFIAAGTWVVLPYAALALVAWRGSPRAAGWLAVLLGSVVLLAMAGLLAIGGDDAVGLVVYFAPAIGLPLSLLAACQLGLVAGGVALMRAAEIGARPFAFVMALALAFGAIASADHTTRYLHSPERRAAVALDQAVDAHDAMLQAHRCLRLHARAHGGYPAALAALGSAGDGCLPDALLAGGDGFALEYAPRGDAGFALHAVAADPRFRESYSRLSDETGMLYAGTQRSDGQEPLPSMVGEVVMEIDLCLEQYRLAHPARGYPPSLAAPDAEGFECFRRSGLGERLRSVVEIGETEGYRYRYTPATADAGGRVAAFRLEVRPVVYGRGLRRSYLCTPEGTLHVTDEDRAAERGDRDEQLDAVTGEVQRRHCLGPDVPARR
jgi:hypothetical protein